MTKIAVLGAGGWGTALAAMWKKAGLLSNRDNRDNDVTLWTPFTAERDALTRDRANRLLPGVILPQGLRIETDIELAVADAEIVVMAVPSKHMRETALRAAPFLSERAVAVSAAKGLERVEGAAPLRMSQVIGSAFAQSRCGANTGLPVRQACGVAAISGPSHAEEVGRDLPTTVVVAGDRADAIRDLCSTRVFRMYTSNDLIGVELGGTLKNPIAIAAGIGRGLGAGDNAMGALVTRGIAEITRLGVAVGAEARTFAGLSGIGDLVTTCISSHSRNGRVGEEISRGKTLDEILSSLGMVAEGVETSRVVDEWAKDLGIETPITSAVARILFERADPKEELEKLMTRSLKDEF